MPVPAAMSVDDDMSLSETHNDVQIPFDTDLAIGDFGVRVMVNYIRLTALCLSEDDTLLCSQMKLCCLDWRGGECSDPTLGSTHRFESFFATT